MMKNNVFDIMIVAAGNGTRMGSDALPKILTEINGKTNLQNTIKKISDCGKIGQIFVIVNKRNRDAIAKKINEIIPYYGHPLMDKIFEIEIESGRGDGHAVLEAYRTILKTTKKKISNTFFVMWGDAYLTSENIFMDCIQEFEKDTIRSMFIPVVNEKDPYVTFVVDKNMNCIGADFSKRGEKHPTGFHDQCVFLCNTKSVIDGLSTLESAYLKNGRYVTDSGELTFLYLVHYFYNIDKPAKALITDSPVLSYNTMGEVKEIEKILLE